MNRNYKVVATKVSAESAQALKNICAKKGITIYDMLQMMCDCVVRYMSDRQNLTPELEQAMSIFEHMEGWQQAFNLADFTTNIEVNEATYYIGDNNRKGVRAVHVTKPWMGQWVQTVNIQQILERTMCLMLPERYMRLRRLAVGMNCTSFLQVIDKLIDEHMDDADMKTIREGFEDADRSDYGVKPTEHRYRRKPRKDMYADDRKTEAHLFAGQSTPPPPDL